MSPVHIAGAFATLIAPVPFAEAAVGLLRARHDWAARRGVPAHVTLLGPLVPSHARPRARHRRLRDRAGADRGAARALRQASGR